MGTGVGIEGDLLHGPTQPPGQMFFFNARIKHFHLLGAHFVIDIVDFGNHHGWIAGQTGFDADA